MLIPRCFLHYVLQIKCIYIILFLCSHVYVHTYVRTYVFMPYVLCYRHVHVHFQLTNTIVALASLHWNSYLCISFIVNCALAW